MLDKLGGGGISWLKRPYAILARKVGFIKSVERTVCDETKRNDTKTKPKNRESVGLWG